MIPIFSIILSLGLPVYALWKNSSQNRLRHPYLFSLASFISCASGIIAEIYTIKRRLFAGDIGGIEDTIDAVILICITLLIVTSVLNAVLLLISYEKD